MQKWTVTASENGEQFMEANFDRKANATKLMNTLKEKNRSWTVELRRNK